VCVLNVTFTLPTGNFHPPEKKTRGVAPLMDTFKLFRRYAFLFRSKVHATLLLGNPRRFRAMRMLDGNELPIVGWCCCYTTQRTSNRGKTII